MADTNYWLLSMLGKHMLSYRHCIITELIPSERCMCWCSRVAVAAVVERDA
jgi:hypothetical protein